MFGFTVLLSSLSSIAGQTRCLFLDDEPWMIRPTLINLNPVQLKYYIFIVSQDKWSRSCNSGNDLSTKICVPSKTKDINIKSCITMKIIHKAKTLVKHILCESKCKYCSTTCNSNQKWNKKTCECKHYCKSKKDFS